MRRLCVLFLISLLWPGLAGAQEGQAGSAWGLDQWGKSRELVAHEALLTRIAEGSGRPDIFTSDGCSGGLSLAWRQVASMWPEFAELHQERPPFEGCCVSHDRAYHGIRGAPTAELSYQARLKADRRLRACVLEVGEQRQADLGATYGISDTYSALIYDQLATAIYYAVRFGGGPCSGQPWRWGYGYPDC